MNERKEKKQEQGPDLKHVTVKESCKLGLNLGLRIRRYRLMLHVWGN